MVTPEGVANHLYIELLDPQLVGALDFLRDENSLGEVEGKMGITASVSQQNSPFFSREQGQINMTIVPEKGRFVLLLDYQPDLVGEPTMVAKIHGDGVPDAVLGKVAQKDAKLRSWVCKVMDVVAKAA
jgi:hypothetical protein